MSHRYDIWVEQFKKLASEESDSEFQEIAQYGIEWATRAGDHERDDENYRDVYG